MTTESSKNYDTTTLCHTNISGYTGHVTICQHVTLLLSDHLHWLRARERISFTLCILVYKAIHGLAPGYLDEMCTPVSTVPYLSALRSAAHGDLVVPRTSLQLGNQAFCVAGPVACNSLPLDIRLAPTLSTFKVMLKTSVFSILLQ